MEIKNIMEEDLYIPNEFDPIWDEYVGMPYDLLPWFMKNEEDQ